jgi:hypothetical protein
MGPLADALCCAWLIYPVLVLVQVSGDRDKLYRLGPTEEVLPEDGDRIHSPKHYVLKNKQDGVFR